MIRKIVTEIKYWKWAAWTLPFVAIITLISLDYLDLDRWYDQVSLAIIVGFYSASVLWWWWALYRIGDIYKRQVKIDQGFEELKKEIKETKKIITSDVSNR